MIRALWLRWHARRHPGHVLVGWNGTALRCGTCLGLPNPENGLPRESRHTPPAMTCRRCGHSRSTHFNDRGSCLHSTPDVVWACACWEYGERLVDRLRRAVHDLR